MGFLSRRPTDNDSPRGPSASPWIEETDVMDETALLLAGLARRCIACRRACRIRYLDALGRCPDCGTEVPT